MLTISWSLLEIIVLIIPSTLIEFEAFNSLAIYTSTTCCKLTSPLRNYGLSSLIDHWKSFV